MKIAIIDYGSGNLRSLERATAAVAPRATQIAVTSEPRALSSADRVIVPGVGSFAHCAQSLVRTGFMEEFAEYLRLQRPFLGICVGHQLLARVGLEHGQHPGLGWVSGVCRLLEPPGDLRVPHMGWNSVAWTRDDHALCASLPDAPYFYFAHSYTLDLDDSRTALGYCDYGEPIVAALAYNQIAGVQFHPEKSQHSGLTFLRNFLSWSP